MIKKFEQYNESVRDLMKPKSEEDVKKVWDKYWEMKQLLHDTYPANAYAVLAEGGLVISWNIVGRSLGYDNLVRITKEITKLLNDNGLKSTGNRSASEEVFRIKN